MLDLPRHRARHRHRLPLARRGQRAHRRRRRRGRASRGPISSCCCPNVLWLGGCFFVLAALTRQMAPVYVAGVVVLVGYLFAVNLLGDMDNKTLAAMIDPSGATAVDVVARYWSVAQKNAQQIPLAGELLLEPRCCGSASAPSSRSPAIAAFRMQAVDVAAHAQAQGSVDASRRRKRRRAHRAAARRARSQRVAYARMLPGPHAALPRRDPAQPALPHDRPRRRAAGRRQRRHAGLVLRHQHLSADLQGARRRRAASSASSS